MICRKWKDEEEEGMKIGDHPVSIGNASQSVTSPENDLPLSVSRKAQKAAIKVYRDIQWKVLHPGGLKKVYDKEFR